MQPLAPPKFILVVEDSLDDFKAIQRAFKRADVTYPLVHCRFGEEALNDLYDRLNVGNAAELPALILLDLNLPGIDGFDVLAKLKQDPELRSIPIVVMTTSDDQQDVQRCYDAGANSYIRKPSNLNDMVRALHALKTYWFDVSLLSHRSRRP